MSGHPSWAGVAILALSVVQTVALAYIGARSKRVRRGDHEAPEEPQDDA